MPTLTDAAIRAAVRANKAKTISDDTKTRGTGRLVLRVRPRDGMPAAATWVAQTWRDGKRFTQTIGQWPSMTLAAARRAQKETEPASAQRNGGTLAELAAAYLQTLKGRRSHDLADLTFRNLLGWVDGNTPANAVKAAELRAWLADTHARAPGLAARARSVVHAAYGWAIRSERSYTAAPGQTWNIDANPVAQIAADPKSRRAGTRSLTPAELVAVYEWALADKNHAARALALQILTGCRVEEALTLTRGHIDGERGLFCWEQTKTGKPHRLPITASAAAILESVEPNGHGLLFPNPARPTEPMRITSLVKIAKRCARDLGLTHWTPRDLRRSWATVAADYAGIGYEARERVQNHALPGIGEVHYSQNAQHEHMKRAALEQWESYFNKLRINKRERRVSNAENVEIFV